MLFWAVTVVNSPREMPDVRLAIGSNSASVWWVNGKEVIGIYNDRQTVIDDGVSRRLTLQKGANIVRAAIVNGGGATDFCARFLDGEDPTGQGHHGDSDGSVAISSGSWPARLARSRRVRRQPPAVRKRPRRWPAPLPAASVTKIRVFYPPNYNANGPQAFPQSNMVVLVDTDAGITGIGLGGSQ